MGFFRPLHGETNWMQRRWFRSCGRKTKFSEEEAQKLAAEYRQRAYYCSICTRWHLTKKKGSISDEDDPYFH